MAGIRLLQPNGVGVLNAAGDQHPSPVEVDADEICQLSFTGTSRIYRWSLSKPSDSASVLSSTGSAGPSFVPDVAGGSYSISLIDENEVEYILDIVTPTSGGGGGGGGGGTVVTTINTYADARAATYGASVPAASMLIQCRAEVDDGGNGLFAYDSEDTTTLDDDGTVLVDGEGHRFKRVFSGPVDGRWFGMVADMRAVSGITVTASSTTIGFTGTTLTAADVGKAIQIRTPNNPAAGTVATLSATALTGTVTSTIGAPEIVGAGTAFLTECWVGMHIKVGTKVGQVVSITDNTHLSTNQWNWDSSASGLSASKYGLVGTSTAFTTELFLGQGITVNGTLYTVQAIADNTHAAVWPLPGASASGLICYRNPLLAALVSSVDTGAHTAAIGSATAAVALSGSSLAAYVGTDNSAALDAAIAVVSARKLELEIPGATAPYMFFAGITPLTNASRGLSIKGNGWGSAAADAFGSPTWDSISSVVAGTILRFAKGNGLTLDDTAVHGVQLSKLALIGPGYGEDTIGYGLVDGHEGDAATIHDVCRNVMICNWGTAWRKVNSLGSLIDTCNIRGNAVGMSFYNSNGQDFVGSNEIDQNGIGVKTVGGSGCSFSKISANFQGNFVWGVYLTAVTSVKFSKCYFESNVVNGGMGNSFVYDVSAGGAIQEVTWDMCHSGDIYVMQPIGMYPTPLGTIDNIDDSTSDFAAAVVRPGWTNWKPSKHYAAVDLRYTQGGIDTLGSFTLGHMRMPNVSPVSVGAGTYTPEVTDGVLRVLLVGGNLTIAAPLVHGVGPGAFTSPAGTTPHYELEFHIRMGGAYAITWDAAFAAHNPWSDVGADSNARAVIRFRHTGGGSWECVYYTPYSAAVSTTRAVRSTPACDAAHYSLDADFKATALTAVARSIAWPIELPSGSTLNTIAVKILPVGGHGALPATMPQIKFRKYVVSTATGTVSSPTVDSSADVTAYQLTHSITMSGIAEVINNATSRYLVQFECEGDANAILGTAVLGITMTFTTTATPDIGAN